MALAIIAALITGVAAGLLNGGLVVGIGIPSLVATIGTQFFLRGLALVLLQGKGATLVGARDSLIYQICRRQIDWQNSQSVLVVYRHCHFVLDYSESHPARGAYLSDW